MDTLTARQTSAAIISEDTEDSITEEPSIEIAYT